MTLLEFAETTPAVLTATIDCDPIPGEVSLTDSEKLKEGNKIDEFVPEKLNVKKP